MAITKTHSVFEQLDLSLLRHFFAIATYGGFSRAARATGSSQPALSLGLQKLEKALGVVLIDRSGNAFSLTQPGLDLFAFCQRLEGNLKSMISTLGIKNMDVRRRLKIGTALSIGFAPFVKVCAQAGRVTEPVELELTTENTYSILNELVEGALDAALVPDDEFDRRLNFVKISQDRVVFIVGKQHLEKVSRSGWKAALEEIPLITYPRETPLRALVDKLCIQENLRFRTVFSVNSVDAIRRLVAKNAGGAFVLQSLVEEELKDKVLFTPKLAIPQPKNGIALATKSGAQGDAISKTVQRMLKGV